MTEKPPAPLLKDGFTAHTVRGIAAQVAGVHPPFDRERFTAHATQGLDGLSLMARVRHVAQSLAGVLPPAFADALPIVERAMGSPPPALVVGEGMAAFRNAPFLEWVSIAGIDSPGLALPALARLTQHFTAEFAIRAFLAAHLDTTLAHAEQWVVHADPRVRRLASEGTRPLLPWGRHVVALKQHPDRALAFIAPLAADVSDSVRRSAANHLNDVGRLDVAVALQHAALWAAGGGEAARATVRHAVRNLVKQGHPQALQLVGFDTHAPVTLSALQLSTPVVAIGGELRVTALLHSTARGPVQACVDYAVTYASARGKPRVKVFKGTTERLHPGEPHPVAFRRDFVPRTTRVLYPGAHAVEVRVNGIAVGSAAFELTA